MRIAEYKQIGTKTETRTIHHEAEYGEDKIIKEAYDETIEVEVPVMGLVYRDETEEEIAQREAQEKAYLESDEYKQTRLQELKDELASTDYKIVKASEYQLLGLESPYDMLELHKSRQALRDEINSIESML